MTAIRMSAVGTDADLRYMPIGDCAMAIALRAASGLNFGAFQPAHRKPGAWLKSASGAPGDRQGVEGASPLQ